MKRERRRPSDKERGTLIIALMAGIAIVMILSTVAVQNWSDVVRRDNEAELIFRAEDLVRGLKRYQAEKGKLPVELKELIEPGQKRQYFLRHLWKDPLVKGGQWQLVYAAPGGGIYDPSVQQAPPPGLGQPAGGLGSSLGSAPSESGAFPPIGGSGEAKAGIGADPTGMPIAGVKTKCAEKAFRKYRNKTEYSEWIFTVFDLEPRQPTPAQTGVNQTPTATFPPQGGTPTTQPPIGIQPPTQIPAPGQDPGKQ